MSEELTGLALQDEIGRLYAEFCNEMRSLRGLRSHYPQHSG